MNAVRAIALNTFREAIRDRILYLILAFALALIALARFVSLLTVGSEVKIVKDLGLSAISVFGLLATTFVGVSLVFKEIERRTVLTLLAQPVRRWQFVVGKYVGLLMVLGAAVGVTGAAVLAAVGFSGEPPWPLIPAIALIAVELALVAAFAVLFSSFTNPILAAVGTVATYVAGHLSWSFELLEKRIASATGRALCRLCHAALDLPAGQRDWPGWLRIAHETLPIIGRVLTFASAAGVVSIPWPPVDKPVDGGA